jgi:hypothetical protein
MPAKLSACYATLQADGCLKHASNHTHPALAMAAMSDASKPHCWNVLMGLGGS